MRLCAASLFAILVSLSPYAYGQSKAPAQESIEALRTQAEKGDLDAQNKLGVRYTNGQLPQDYAEAVKWYRKAADGGYAKAQSNLGFMYALGHGVPQDYAEAVKWFRKAADAGDAGAQFNLGLAYSRGQGVPRDVNEAKTWFGLAAEQGNEAAKQQLAALSGGGVGGGAAGIGGGVSPPSVLSKAEPEYSNEALAARLEGTVTLSLLVDEQGHPQNLKVVNSLGLGLDEKAIEAVQKWRFKPGMKDGKPVAVIANIAVNFRLGPEMKIPAEPEPIKPEQYEPPTISVVKGNGVELVNYSGLQGEPMVALLEKARKAVGALPGVLVAVTPPGDDPVSFANPADFIGECGLRACAKDEITRSRDLATNGGYVVLRIVKQGSGTATAEAFFQTAVHEFRHIKDFQDAKRSVALGSAQDWSQNHKIPHDSRPEEIRANRTAEEVMKKLRDHRDTEWEQMVTELAKQVDAKWFAARRN